MDYVFIVVGFILLILGADWLVKGGKGIAARLGVSKLIIGLTIVSIGTSLPEMLVNVMASLGGNSGLAIGNVLGSNIANILLIIGTTAIICNLSVRRSTVVSEIPFSLTAAILVGFLANSALWYESSHDLFLSRGDGLILLLFFFLFMAYIFSTEKSEETKLLTPDKPIKVSGNLLFIGFGVASLYLGGKWVVDGAVSIAKVFEISDALIGLTIVAVGTSLPELVTSISSALKNDADIAVGNAIGSNIFNILWVLGISAVIKPIPFDVASNIDIFMVIGSGSLILFALIVGRRMVIKRIEGVIFLSIYITYLYFLIRRG